MKRLTSIFLILLFGFNILNSTDNDCLKKIKKIRKEFYKLNKTNSLKKIKIRVKSYSNEPDSAELELNYYSKQGKKYLYTDDYEIFQDSLHGYAVFKEKGVIFAQDVPRFQNYYDIMEKQGHFFDSLFEKHILIDCDTVTGGNGIDYHYRFQYNISNGGNLNFPKYIDFYLDSRGKKMNKIKYTYDNHPILDSSLYEFLDDVRSFDSTVFDEDFEKVFFNDNGKLNNSYSNYRLHDSRKK